LLSSNNAPPRGNPWLIDQQPARVSRRGQALEQTNTRVAVVTSRHHIRTAAALFNDPIIESRKASLATGS
jgi:hypothetical protein